MAGIITDVNGDVIRRSKVQDGKMYNSVEQDIEPYLKDNHELRASRGEHQKYKGNLVKAASIPMVFIDKMANGQCCADGVKYNMMSADPEEKRRALMHIQACHKELLTVNGKPFAMQRTKWQ